VLSASYLLCDIKARNRIHNEGFNELVRAFHDELLPAGNLLPSSLHLMRGLMECTPAEHYEGHACDHCGWVFPKLEKTEWPAHFADQCEECNSSRFKGSKRFPIPRKRFWDFGVGNCIREWLADEDFASQRGKGRDLDDVATFLGSPYGKLIDEAIGHAFRDGKHVSYYTLGMFCTAGLLIYALICLAPWCVLVQ
jgi:hypothetical protein